MFIFDEIRQEMQIKEFIKTNLLDKKQNFNSKVVKYSWWKNRHLINEYNQIMELTSHLPAETTLTRRAYDIMNDITKIHNCDVCAKNPKPFINYKEGYNYCCSRSCSARSEQVDSKRRKTKLERYGDEYFRNLEKAAENNLAKYGVKWTTQTQNFKDKSKETKLERYGDENYCNREQSYDTNMQKYGVKYTCNAPEVIEKMLENKTVLYPQLRDKEWLVNENKTKSIVQISKELGASYRTVYLWFEKHNIDIIFHAPNYSKLQDEIYEFVSQYSTAKINDRNSINPKELDIFVESKNFAIELNGAYWHSEDKNRHIQKRNLCLEKGIKLIQFWDHEWITKREICESIIRTNLGLNETIYARKCQIKQIENVEYREFLENNHIQGFVAASIKLALIYQDEIVAVMSFGKSRFNKTHDWELLRYCNKLNHNVIGGFSKLLKFANLFNVISYCDLRLFDGKIYESNGFERIGTSEPNFFFYKQGKILPRLQCQKHNVKKHLKNYDETKSVHLNMNAEGWLKVYDCGNSVYSKKS